MYKHLLMSSKTKKIGKQLIKEKGIREKLEKEMRNEKNNWKTENKKINKKLSY